MERKKINDQSDRQRLSLQRSGPQHFRLLHRFRTKLGTISATAAKPLFSIFLVNQSRAFSVIVFWFNSVGGTWLCEVRLQTSGRSESVLTLNT